MATIASLLVNLGMNTAGFTAGTRKASKDWNSFKTGLTAGIASAVANKALGGLETIGNRALATISDTISRVDDLGDLAARLNTGASKLSELQYIARHTDTDFETLNASLEKFNVLLGDANSADKFAELGLDVNNLKQLDVSDAMLQTFAAIRDLGNGSEQGYFAKALFGKSGPQLLTMIRTSSDEMLRLGMEGRKTGAILSDMDIAKIGQLDEELKHASDTIQGMTNMLTVSAARHLAGGSSAFGKLVADLSSGNLLKIARHANGVGFLFDMAQGMEDYDRAVDDAIYKNKDFAKSNEEVAASFENFSALAEHANKVLEESQPPANRFESDLLKINQAFEAGAIDLSQWGALFDDATKTMAERLDKVFEDALDKDMEQFAQGWIEQLKSPAAKLKEELMKIDESVASGFLSDEQGGMAAEMLRNQEQLRQLQENASRLQELAVTDSGPLRSAALERGTAAAFSASFGSRPVDRNQAELVQLNRQIRDLLKRLDDKITEVDL